ncbi:hypothetical protein TNCV_392751 [Trichonephila clavipes]|nr:hypothetical protein TNCV_392751 [Trichonephila clavipes]
MTEFSVLTAWRVNTLLNPLLRETIRSGIEAYKLRMMSRDISFHICCNHASSSFKRVGCPTRRQRWSQICSIGDKSGDRVGQGRLVSVRRQSCDTLAV